MDRRRRQDRYRRNGCAIGGDTGQTSAADLLSSPGGSLVGSLELKRLIRQQRLVAGVAQTIPRGCDRDNSSTTKPVRH
jgi:hypothetical protein